MCTAAALVASVAIASARASAGLLHFPALNAVIAHHIDEHADGLRGEPIVDGILAEDTPMLAGSPMVSWLTFELKLDGAAMPIQAARNWFANAQLEVDSADGAAPHDAGPAAAAGSHHAGGIDNTWLHVNRSRLLRETSPIFDRISFSAGEQSLRLFGPRYEGAPRLTLPSVYSVQITPGISLNQDFHFMYDPLGPERDFEDTWATGFRVQIRF